jgi:hypothetical protein
VNLKPILRGTRQEALPHSGRNTNIAAWSAQDSQEDLVTKEASVLEETAAIIAVEQVPIQKVGISRRKLAGGSKNA